MGSPARGGRAGGPATWGSMPRPRSAAWAVSVSVSPTTAARGIPYPPASPPRQANHALTFRGCQPLPTSNGNHFTHYSPTVVPPPPGLAVGRGRPLRPGYGMDRDPYTARHSCATMRPSTPQPTTSRSAWMGGGGGMTGMQVPGGGVVDTMVPHHTHAQGVLYGSGCSSS